jgi:hypothetical protein
MAQFSCLTILSCCCCCCVLPGRPGLRRQALVINLPGKPKSIRETFDEVFRSIPYCIQLAGGPYIETHRQVVDAFRPPADKRHQAPGAVLRDAAAAAAAEAAAAGAAHSS